MKILFLQFGSKYSYCEENDTFYTDGSLNDKIWNRYLSYADELTVIGKIGKQNIQLSDTKRLNPVNKSINLILVDDIFNPKSNYFNVKLRKKINNIINSEIYKNDLVVIRSITNNYNLYAAKRCIKTKKEFIVEVTGFASSLWYHKSFFGKIMSVIIDIKMKSCIKRCKNVLYVTNKSLQKKYPNCFNNIGCSDVEIQINNEKLIRKINYFNNEYNEQKMTFGTIGQVDSKLKGQDLVIKAIAYFKHKKGIQITYELVGRGNNNNLKKLAEKLDVLDNIIFVGELKHDEVFKWFDKLDVYLQPSYTEGLCRSIVEAMSCACPIIATSVGGNVELTSPDLLFKKGNYKSLIKIIENLSRDKLIISSKNSFDEAKKFDKDYLDSLRDDFYKKIIEDIKRSKK